MPPQMYLVEFVVERLRKTPPRKEVTVYRWVVIANSDQEAIAIVRNISVISASDCKSNDLTIDSLRSETAYKTKGEWSATIIGQSMSLPTQRSPIIHPIVLRT